MHYLFATQKSPDSERRQRIRKVFSRSFVQIKYYFSLSSNAQSKILLQYYQKYINSISRCVEVSKIH